MKKICPTCKHSEWQTTAQGRRRLDSPAKCHYPEIKMPHSFADYRGDMPKRKHVTKYTADNCPCWERP
jgi:hypothetical protein